MRRREQVSAEGAEVQVSRVLLRLSITADVFQLEAELKWARHAREMLSWLASQEDAWPAPRREREGGR